MDVKFCPMGQTTHPLHKYALTGFWRLCDLKKKRKKRSCYWTCSLEIHKSSLAKILFLTHDFSWFIPQCMHFVTEEFLERKWRCEQSWNITLGTSQEHLDKLLWLATTWLVGKKKKEQKNPHNLFQRKVLILSGFQLKTFGKLHLPLLCSQHMTESSILHMSTSSCWDETQPPTAEFHITGVHQHIGNTLQMRK